MEVEEEEEASVLEKFAKDKANYEDTKLPKWLYKYLVYRFNLLDRTGKSWLANVTLKGSIPGSRLDLPTQNTL